MKQIVKQEEATFIMLQTKDVLDVAPVMDELIRVINERNAAPYIDEDQALKAYKVLKSIGFLPYHETLEEEEEDEEEIKLYDVALVNAGTAKLNVIKEIKEIFPKMGLAEAKSIVDDAPSYIARRVGAKIAQKLKENIENAGGEVKLEGIIY